MSDLHQHIADLEAEIDRLSDAAERCWKIAVAAKAMMVAGGLLLLISMVGLFRLGAPAFVIAVAAVLAGIALFGSNKRTRDEIAATVKAHEQRRGEMIDGLGLRKLESG
jgi:hypothetical protein